jgi:hypothetical protein
MMTAHVSCERGSQALLAVLEPERQGWVDSGVSQVTRGQGHRPKWVGYLTGAISADSILKVLTSGENHERLKNSRRIVAQGLLCFHRVEMLPGMGWK